MQCYHCGRKVLGITHTQNYRIEFGLLHTRHTEWKFPVSPKHDAFPSTIVNRPWL